MDEINQEAQHLLAQLQGKNQQLQNVMLQKHALDIQATEIENALKELEKTGDEIYKNIGPVLIRTDKKTLKKELEEKKEEITLKAGTLDKQQKKIKDGIKTDQEKFQKFLPQQ